MKAYVKRYFFTVFIFLFTLSALVFVFQGQVLQVTKISIQMDENIKQSSLHRDLSSKLEGQLNEYVGQYIWKVKLPSLLELVLKDARVESAKVIRRFPNRLAVYIQPHRPLALILGKREQLHPIAKNGKLLPALAITQGPDLPIVRGSQFLKNVDLRKSLTQLLLDLPKTGAFTSSEISEIHYSQRQGFVLQLVESASIVKMGKLDFKNKSQRVSKVLNYLRSQGLGGRVIDARLSKKVVVRLRNQP